MTNGYEPNQSHCDFPPLIKIQHAVELAIHRHKHNLLDVILRHPFWDKVTDQLEQAVNGSGSTFYITAGDRGSIEIPWSSYEYNPLHLRILHPVYMNHPEQHGWVLGGSGWKKTIIYQDLYAKNNIIGYINNDVGDVKPIYEQLFEWVLCDNDYYLCNKHTIVYKLNNSEVYLGRNKTGHIIKMQSDIIDLSVGDFKTRILPYINPHDPSLDDKKLSCCSHAAPFVDYTTVPDDVLYSDPFLTLKSFESDYPTMFEPVGFSIGDKYQPSCLVTSIDGYLFHPTIPDVWDDLSSMMSDEYALMHSQDLLSVNLEYGVRGPKFIRPLNGVVNFYSVCDFYKMIRLRYCTVPELFPYNFNTRPVVNNDFLLCEDVERIVHKTDYIYNNSWKNNISYQLYIAYDDTYDPVVYTEKTYFHCLPLFSNMGQFEDANLFILKVRLEDNFYHEPQCDIPLEDIQIQFNNYHNWYSIEYLGSNTEAYHYAVTMLEYTENCQVTIDAIGLDDDYHYDNYFSNIWRGDNSPTTLPIPLGNVSIYPYFYTSDSYARAQVGIFICSKYNEQPITINPQDITFIIDGDSYDVSSTGDVSISVVRNDLSTKQCIFMVELETVNCDNLSIHYNSTNHDYPLGGFVSIGFNRIRKYFSPPVEILNAPLYEDIEHYEDTTSYVDTTTCLDSTCYVTTETIIETTYWTERVWIRDYNCLIVTQHTHPDIIYELDYDDFHSIDGIYGVTSINGNKFLTILNIIVDDNGQYIDESSTSFIYNGEIIHSKYMGHESDSSYFFGVILNSIPSDTDTLVMRVTSDDFYLYYDIDIFDLYIDADVMVESNKGINIEFIPKYNRSGYPLNSIQRSIGCLPLQFQGKTYCSIFKVNTSFTMDPMNFYVAVDGYEDFYPVHYNGYNSQPPSSHDPFYLRYIGTDGYGSHLYCIQLKTSDFKIIRFEYFDDIHYSLIMTYEEFKFKIWRNSSDVKEMCYSNNKL